MLHTNPERAVDDPVTATINGETVTWANKYKGSKDTNANNHGDTGPDGVGEMVTATINDQIVHWTNDYAGPSAATSAQQTSIRTASNEIYTSQATTAAHHIQDLTSSTEAFANSVAKTPSTVPTNSLVNIASKASSILSAKASQAAAYFGNKAAPKTQAKPLPQTPAKATSKAPAKSSSKSSSKASSSTSAVSTSAPSGSWGRQAYYNAAQGHVEGLVFLNHFGNANALPG